MSNLLDRVNESTATVGTGTITLSGTAVATFSTWSTGGAQNGLVYNYLIIDGNNSEWGYGTYTASGTTLSRDTVLGSIASGVRSTSKLTLSGSATVACSAVSRNPIGRALYDLPPMLPLSSFTQGNFAGTCSAVENSGKAITIVDTAPPVDPGRYEILLKAPPAAPYRVAMFCLFDAQASNFAQIIAGFRDSGTGKLEAIEAGWVAGYAGSYQTWNSYGSRNGASTINQIQAVGAAGLWLGLRDDNAGNVYFEMSASGAYWVTIHKTVKSGGWLANYSSQIFWGINANDNVNSPALQQAGTLLCWDENGLNRVAGA